VIFVTSRMGTMSHPCRMYLPLGFGSARKQTRTDGNMMQHEPNRQHGVATDIVVIFGISTAHYRGSPSRDVERSFLGAAF